MKERVMSLRQNTFGLLLKAQAMGVDKIKPAHKGVTQEGWDRGRRIAYNEQEATDSDLASQEGVTRARIGQIRKQFTLHLIKACYPGAQPKALIASLRKPLPQAARDRWSLSQGGISLGIKNEILSGNSNVRDIQEKLGLSSDQIADSRIVLRGWGIDLPKKNMSHDEIRKKVEREDDDNKLKEFLYGLPSGVIRSFFLRREEGKKPVFILVGRLPEKLGFKRKESRSVMQTLIDMGMPIRPLPGPVTKVNGREYLGTYWVSYEKRGQKIIDELRLMRTRFLLAERPQVA